MFVSSVFCKSIGNLEFIKLVLIILVDCEYSDWNEWQECDKQCGGGTQSRTREVTREAWYGGIKCTDEDAIESQKCNEQLCSGR